jgi:hypothetical protein
MANNAKIKVVANNDGNIISISPNNPEWGSIRIEQRTISFNSKGFRDSKVRTFFFKGRVEELQEDNITLDTEFTGNIVIKESFEPFFTNTEHPNYEQLRDKDLKIAGDTGIVCKGVDPETGELRDIYRTTEYDSTGTKQDVLIAHVNGDEIRAANSSNVSVNISKSEMENLTKGKKKEEPKIEDPVEEVVEMEEESFEL